MSELSFSLVYDGRSASRHRIDMRGYGRGLIGIDRMVNIGLIGLAERRIPRGRQSLRLQIDMTPPEEGSVATLGVVLAAYQGLQPLLPFLIEEVRSKGFDIVWTWLAASFKVLGGRPSDASEQIERVVDFLLQVDERRSEDARYTIAETFKDRQNEREFVLKLIESQRHSARDAVAPVGTSASNLYLGRSVHDRSLDVDEAMAASIRADFPIVVGDLKHVVVEFDGFRRSAKNVWVRRIGIDED